jgi:signal transduction histidine kinase/DNA-binding response OmpR family regulator
MAIALAGIPVIATGSLLGMQAGLVGSLLVCLLNGLFLTRAEETGCGAIIQASLPSIILLVPLGALVGRLRDLRLQAPPSPHALELQIPSENPRLLEEVVREREVVQTLLDTAEALNSTLQLDELLGRVLDELQRVVPYDAASISLLHDEHCWTIASRGLEHTPSRPFTLRELPLMEQVVHERGAVIVPDVRDHPDRAPKKESSPVHSRLGVPLLFKDRVVGVLMVDSHRANAYDEGASRLALAIAHQIAMVIESSRLYEQTQAQFREATLLHRVTTALSSTLDASQILPYVAHSLCEILHGTSVEIYSLDEEARSITVIADYVTSDATEEEQRSALGQAYSLAHLPTTAESLAQRRPLQIQVDLHELNAAQADPRERIRLEARGVQATLLLPMIAGDRTLGLAQVWDSRGPRRFTDREVAAGQTLVHQASIAMDHARLFEETQRRVRELRFLHDVGLAAASGVRIEETLQAAATALAAELQDIRVTIFLQDPKSDRLRVHASAGYPPGAITSLSFQRDEGIPGQVARYNKPIMVPDVRLSPDYIATTPDTRSALCVPMSSGPYAIGVLNIESPRTSAFTDDDRQLLSTLANNLALLVERARLFEEVEAARVELEHRAEALEQANVRLQELDRLKSQFLANMSHELRTPLNSIIGFSEVLIDGLMGDIPPEQKESIQDIHSSGRHLLALIDSILDLSKIEAGRVKLEPVALDVAELLAEVQTTVSPLIEEKSQVLTGHLADDGPLLIADRFRIKQVLLNLLNNANKFTPDGGHITLSCRLAAPDTALFSVADTGIGIKPEDQEIIFEEFRQANGSSARESPGTGLGLTISRRLIEMHSGRLWVESKYGHGATVHFLLPLAGPPTPEPASEAASLGEIGLPSRHKTALVVEDDHEVSNLLALYLQQEGYTPVQHWTGTGTLERARELRPTLIALEVALPDQDGWDVLRALKSDPKTEDIPVLIVSPMEDSESAINLGATDHLTKPLCRDDVHASLKRLMPEIQVLLVDDDPEIVAMLQAMLPAEWCTSLAAYDGDQGVAIARRERPDAIFLDLMLPGVSGFEVLERLRANVETADIPVIVLTAKDVTVQEHTLIDAHIQGLMYKTEISPQSLVAELRRLKVIR